MLCLQMFTNNINSSHHINCTLFLCYTHISILHTNSIHSWHYIYKFYSVLLYTHDIIYVNCILFLLYAHIIIIYTNSIHSWHYTFKLCSVLWNTHGIIYSNSHSFIISYLQIVFCFCYILMSSSWLQIVLIPIMSFLLCQ